MSVYSPEYHAMMISPGKSPGSFIPINTGLKASEASADKPVEPHESFFHHLLDVVNPLQHLPVIGTIYRAITGERLDPVEKIAGDTLYGGLWGAVTSIADVAFESLTGKSFEDTALALFKGNDSTKVAGAAAPAITVSPSLASADPTPLSAIAAANAPVAIPASTDVAALTSALSAKGVDNDTATRALYAYRRSMGLTAPVPVLASVH
jgi:hypothetical protein